MLKTSEPLSAANTGGEIVQKIVYRHYTDNGNDCFDFCYYASDTDTSSISDCDDIAATRPNQTACTASASSCNELSIPSELLDETSSNSTFTLTSDAIVDGFMLEDNGLDSSDDNYQDYQCVENVNNQQASLPLSWENAPENTHSFAITMTHVDAQNNTNSYLLLWDIDSTTSGIPYGEAGDHDNGYGYMGQNKDGVQISYSSPCSGSAGTHDYTLTLYALDANPLASYIDSSLDVDYELLMNGDDSNSGINGVTILDTAVLDFSVVVE